ncbi:MAG TPA: cation:proton antiporter [Fimbriimonadaceae bacterium]|nr:cation:proton antiporter [Fimbriimonadaceae bacterium]
MPHGWNLLLDLAITLAAAFLLGAMFERVRINAILGYLLAGVLLGPRASGVIQDIEVVRSLAEVGIALLLFSIGLEFSWKRLARMGSPALGGGSLQIVLTGAATAGVVLAAGMDAKAAVAIGAIVALSSTAIVLQVLRDRNELDSVYGKNALGILLVQDVALVPLVLLLTAIGGQSLDLNPGDSNTPTLGKVVAVAVGFLVVLGLLLPRALLSRTIARNRELPILLAITTVLGAAYAAHSVGVSPSLGAFLAGMMLAESQYAVQIRADVGPLRAAFVTLFFASVGMLADIGWIGSNIWLVLSVALAVVVGKAAIAAFTLRLFRQTILSSLASGIALAQIGELSFVLLVVATTEQLLPAGVSPLISSVAVLTLLASPFLVASASPAARALAKRFFNPRRLAGDERQGPKPPKLQGHAIVVGYGDAGHAAVAELCASARPILVIDLNRQLVDLAVAKGHHGLVGDATSSEVLEAAHIKAASALVLALPDFECARTVAGQARRLGGLPVIARARYHVVVADIADAGAHYVVDEEELVGSRLGQEALRMMDAGDEGSPRGD